MHFRDGGNLIMCLRCFLYADTVVAEWEWIPQTGLSNSSRAKHRNHTFLVLVELHSAHKFTSRWQSFWDVHQSPFSPACDRNVFGLHTADSSRSLEVCLGVVWQIVSELFCGIGAVTAFLTGSAAVQPIYCASWNSRSTSFFPPAKSVFHLFFFAS